MTDHSVVSSTEGQVVNPEPAPPRSPAALLGALEAHDGVTRLHLPAGQVLVYCEHRAPGVFVVVEGAVELGQGRGRSGRQEARRGKPLVLPPPDRLAESFEETLVIAEDAELLFLPRTLVQSDTGVLSLLEKLGPR